MRSLWSKLARIRLGEKKNNVRAHGESGTDTDTETGTGMEKGAGKDLPACMSVR